MKSRREERFQMQMLLYATDVTECGTGPYLLLSLIINSGDLMDPNLVV